MIIDNLKLMRKHRKSISDNFTYPEFCLKASVDDLTFNTFRNNEIYKNILEHIDYNLALSYYDLLLKKYKLAPKKIYSMIKKLNYTGGPSLIKIDDSIPELSATGLRYLFTGLEIKDFVKKNNLQSSNIVELGCGYGGQSIILQELLDIDNYTYVDLNEVNLLIKRFINNYDINFKPIYKTLKSNFNSNYDIFISNYSFSELPRNLQKKAVKKIINNSLSGYMIINSENFSKKYNFMKKDDYKNLFKNYEIYNEFPQSSQRELNYVYKFIKD